MREYRGNGKYMTWRELLEALSELPVEVLDDEACVWLPSDVDAFDEFQRFTGISGYDMDMDISSENPASLTIGA